MRVSERIRQTHMRTIYSCPLRPGRRRGVIGVARLSPSLYLLAHKTKVLIGKQQLGAHVSAWNSPELEAAIHQKGGLPLPENGCGGWRCYLAKMALGIAKNDDLAEIEVIITQMRIIRNNIISSLSIALVQLL